MLLFKTLSSIELNPWEDTNIIYGIYFRYKNGSQIGGYATVYEGNLTFTTVRGGRHEVPETAPEKAAELIRRLIHGEQF